MCRCGGTTMAASREAAARSSERESSSSAPMRSAAARDVTLAYVGKNALLLKGPISRKVYALRPGMPPLPVDARDAPVFVASPLFEEV